MSAKVLMYCTAACPFCQAAERLLVEKGAAIEKVRVDLQPELRAEMTKKAGGRRTVPQIWIAGRHVGGCDDLYELDRKGELDPLLKDPA
jgi:glutaredoxin 3